jgi:hypothetical protein
MDPIRLCAARTLALLHVAILSLFVFGWALPWRAMLVAVVVSAPIVQAGWWIFRDRCVLTLLEKRLRGSRAPAVATPGADADPPPNFIADLARSVLGRPVSHGWVDLVARVVMWSAFGIAALRLTVGA